MSLIPVKPTIVFLICCSHFIVSINSEKARYDNYRVYHVQTATSEDVAVFQSLSENSDSYKFFQLPHHVGHEAHIVVPPHKFAEFTELLNFTGMTFDIVEYNLQSQIEAEQQMTRILGTYDWTMYYPLEAIHTWLKQMVNDYPGKATLINIGKSFEGRDILGVKISSGDSENSGIFIESGIHAREWIAPATATYIINELLTSNDVNVREMSDNYNWFIIPVVNPDGYAYTFEKDRMWRKNRRTQVILSVIPIPVCVGVDLNRNFDYHWGEGGASVIPCLETYQGRSASSEIETTLLSQYIATNDASIDMHLSLHSYSQFMVYPYGYTSSPAPDRNILDSIASKTVIALKQRYGTQYAFGNVYDTLYQATGSSLDWVYGKGYAKVAYTFELRPNSSTASSTGFMLDKAQIVPNCEEFMDGLLVLVSSTKEAGLIN